MPFSYVGSRLVAIQDRSTIVWGYNLVEVVSALDKHLKNDFCPAYRIPAPTLSIIQPSDPIPVGYEQCLIVDEAKEPGAEGYHDLTDDGWPIMYVGVKDTLSAGDKVPTTICHEVDEDQVDPAVNLVAEAPDGIEWALESNDAVETDEYLVDGVPMSNFQTPAWFMGNLKPGQAVRFDFMGLCTRPFEIRPGGYASVKRHGRWTEIFGSKESKAQHARRARRRHALRELGGRHAHRAAREVARMLHIEQVAQYVY